MIQVFFCTSNAYMSVLSITFENKIHGVVVIDNTVNGFILYGPNGNIKDSWSFPFETTDFRLKKEYILKTLNNLSEV